MGEISSLPAHFQKALWTAVRWSGSQRLANPLISLSWYFHEFLFPFHAKVQSAEADAQVLLTFNSSWLPNRFWEGLCMKTCPHAKPTSIYSCKRTNKACSGTKYHITFSVLNLSQSYSFLTDETIQTPKMVVAGQLPRCQKLPPWHTKQNTVINNMLK